jgi:glycerol uptake facilitator-like aquaporin
MKKERRIKKLKSIKKKFSVSKMLDYIAEYVGTLIFVLVVLYTKSPILAVISLLAMLYAASTFSKGSINPAVSIGLFVTGSLTAFQVIMYIIVECLAGLTAAYIYKLMS